MLVPRPFGVEACGRHWQEIRKGCACGIGNSSGINTDSTALLLAHLVSLYSMAKIKFDRDFEGLTKTQVKGCRNFVTIE